MSQDSLARAAGIGRSTVVHLENGADVRLAKIEAVARSLNASVQVIAADDSPEIAARRLARARMNERNVMLINAHLRIALDLISRKPEAITALEEARERVALWAREATCSAFYIESWRKALDGAPAGVGRALANLDPQWELALMQNSPFGSALLDKGLAA